jgi:5-methyltetrahydropteroyltriglutamate--homocysteine methyltransferase
MPNRPFRADHVGSMLRPERLLKARSDHRSGAIHAVSLRKVEDESIEEVVRLQEEAGLQSVTDGEFRRTSYSHDFLSKLDNVAPAEGKLEIFFRNPDGTRSTSRPTSMKISGKVARSKPIQLDDFRFLKSLTSRHAKVCIPSPTLLHFRGGREGIDKKAYPDLDVFFADVAAAYRHEIRDLVENGLTYLQIDDVNLAYLCDPDVREAVRNSGQNPEALLQTYVDLINRCVEGVPDDVIVCIHLCRGNGATGGVASGGYEPIADALFNGLEVDGFFLEYDDERSGDFAPLRFLPRGKTAVLGLASTKRPEVESKDVLKRRLDEATRVVALDRLALSPQCGFSSGARDDAKSRPLSIEDEKRKLSNLVETAYAVWGEL